MSITEISRPARGASTPICLTPGGIQDTQRANEGTTPKVQPPAGEDSRPAVPAPIPGGVSPGGSELTGRQTEGGAQIRDAASDQPADRHHAADARGVSAVGSDGEQGQAAVDGAATADVSLLDPALCLAADVLDDLERVRTANDNRLRQLTRSVEDSDGEVRGFGLDESHPDVARLAAMVDALKRLENDATLQLQRQLRRHPLHVWVKAQKGVGEKQAARLLAAIGDPYIRPELVREDGTVIPEGPRTVSALWAYCGLHVVPAGHRGSEARTGPAGGDGGDPGHDRADTQDLCAGVAPKRQRGQQANWSTNAKTRAYLIAESCLKQLVKPCTGTEHVDSCACSPYRLVYDLRRAHTAVTRPDWTDGHSHNDALRVASKAILRDLWRAARDIHLATPEGTPA